jgi:hypothetical protein
VLRYYREALVKQKLEAIVVRLDDKGASPKVRPLVLDGLRQCDQLTLVRGKAGMSWRHGSAEEGYRPLFLV